MSKTQLYFILALLCALVGAVFAIQNTDPVRINFLAWQFGGISKVLVILASTAVGALVVVFLGLWWQFKRFRYIRHLESQIENLKKQLVQIPPAVAEASPAAVPAAAKAPAGSGTVPSNGRAGSGNPGQG